MIKGFIFFSDFENKTSISMCVCVWSDLKNHWSRMEKVATHFSCSCATLSEPVNTWVELLYVSFRRIEFQPFTYKISCISGY